MEGKTGHVWGLVPVGGVIRSGCRRVKYYGGNIRYSCMKMDK
jgi:hypothetical protein